MEQMGKSWHSRGKSRSTAIKGHNTQHIGHAGQFFFQTEKTIEIQLVRPTEVCGKV